MDAAFDQFCSELTLRLRGVSPADAGKDSGLIRVMLSTPSPRWTGELSTEAFRVLKRAGLVKGLEKVAAPAGRESAPVPGLLDIEDGVLTLVTRGLGMGKVEEKEEKRLLTSAGFSFDRENGVWRQRIAAMTADSLTSTEVSALMGLFQRNGWTHEAKERLTRQMRKASPGERFIHAVSESHGLEPVRLAVVFPFDERIIADFKETTRGLPREFSRLSLGLRAYKCWFVTVPAQAVADFTAFSERHCLPLIGAATDQIATLQKGVAKEEAAAKLPLIQVADGMVVLPVPSFNPVFTDWIKGLGAGGRFWRNGPAQTGPAWVFPADQAHKLVPLLRPVDGGLRFPAYRVTPEAEAVIVPAPSASVARTQRPVSVPLLPSANASVSLNPKV